MPRQAEGAVGGGGEVGLFASSGFAFDGFDVPLPDRFFSHITPVSRAPADGPLEIDLAAERNSIRSDPRGEASPPLME